ncbi:MAG: hypothetical protein IKE95_03150 [Methanobrevibacter sp.]|nr:hypothetical protein [Methanobrevibacter sp.]
MAYCRSSDDKIRKVRCNNVDHQKDVESSESFILIIEESKAEELIRNLK